MRRSALVVAALVALAALAVARVVVVADVHYEWSYSTQASVHAFCRASSSAPPSNSSLGRWGCDTPPALLAQLLGSVESVKAELMINLGDHAPHHMAEWQQETGATRNQTLNIMGQVTANITRALLGVSNRKGAVYVAALGNEDFLPDDNAPANATGAEYLSFLAETALAPMFAQKEFSPDAKETFSQGGFYRVDPSPTLSLLVLHTVIYMRIDDETECDGSLADPFSQFLWLSGQLAEIERQNRTVWIIGHVPPVLDIHSFKPLWKPCYSSSFFSLLRQHESILGALLFGHEHASTLGCGSDYGMSESAPSFLLHPSVTPVDGNNPAFRIIETENDKPVDYSDFYLELKESVFADAAFQPLFSSALSSLGLSSLLSGDVAAFGAHIEKHHKRFATFWTDAYLSSPAAPRCTSRKCMAEQACVIQHLNHTAWHECHKKSR